MPVIFIIIISQPLQRVEGSFTDDGSGLQLSDRTRLFPLTSVEVFIIGST
jgi:hypothetical protein